MGWLRGQDSVAIPQFVKASPRGFKSNLETLLDALIQLRLSATVLAKLPQGSSWVEGLKHYSRAVNPTPDIYVLTRRALLSADELINVPISMSEAMQGRYDLVVVSEAGGVLISGHRETANASSEGDSDIADSQPTEEINDSPKINLVVTLQPSLIQRKLQELRQVMQASLLKNPNQPALKALISRWDDRLQIPENPDPVLLDAFLMAQAQQQERMRQQAGLYQRQAMTASNLSTQNESLLNTLRSKDDFLNTVGQALRSPLSTIKTALPLLSSPNLKQPQRQRYLEMISRECDRQSSLINGFLDLLHLEQSAATTKLEPVRLFDVVPGVVSTYQPIAQEKGIRLAYTVPSDLPQVCCPEGWMRQIMIHLLSNSIRYTEAGGEVWVTVQKEDEESLILNVKDTGTGIPPSELPHIFNHFYRGRQPNQDEGAGLGLTIVQQLLFYCGGQISVESQPNLGTHFKVKLLLHQKPLHQNR